MNMRPPLCLQLTGVTMVVSAQVTGSLLEETTQKWAQYKEKCLKDLRKEASGKHMCWVSVAT